MEVLFCYVIIYLVEAFILWLYCNDLFIAKYSTRQTIISLLIFYSLLFILTRFDSYLLNSFAFFMVNLLFISLFYTIKWSSALFHAGITTVSIQPVLILVYLLYLFFSASLSISLYYIHFRIFFPYKRTKEVLIPKAHYY